MKAFVAALSFALCCSLEPVAAQPTPPAGNSPNPGRPAPGASENAATPVVNAKEHIIQAGDQVELRIHAIPEMQTLYTVRADGRFFHPLAGEVPAAGLKLDQLQKLLTTRLKKELRNPSFKVGIHTLARGEVSVLGEVKSQGKLPINAGTSLLDLLAQVGGLTSKADPEGAYILRQGKQIPVDLRPENQMSLTSFKIQNGDIFYVNPGRRISVVGEVREAGVYAVSTKSTHPVDDALKAAGGAKETAALTRMTVVRAGAEKPIPLSQLKPAEGSTVVELQDGDTLLVPPRAAIVLGAFPKPGTMPLTGSEMLMDIISTVNTKDAELNNVVVIRAEDVRSGNPKKELYDMTKMFEKDQGITQVPIYDGDLVYVPAKNQQQGGILNGPVGGFLQLIMLGRTLLTGF